MRIQASWIVLYCLALAPRAAAQEWWPERLELGLVAAGEVVIGEAWLANAGETERVLEELVVHPAHALLVGGCEELERLEAGEARRLSWRVQVPERYGERLEGRLEARFDDGEVVSFSWRVQSADPGFEHSATLRRAERLDPRVAAIERYFDARDRDDERAKGAAWAEDARLCFDVREGEGMPRKPAGGGPWSGWDGELFKVLVVERVTFNEAEAAVDVVVRERNDYYRLLERPSAPYLLRYWLDEEHRISGRLVTALDAARERAPDRFEEFRSWAEEQRPEELAVVWPGKIVPSAENARRFRALLVEWRAASGLPDALRSAR